ncbi:hypothetical protein BCR32DRAFT_265610 [Anaeromyces robustus]|uniref:SBF-domain-containing protein n=1 Tax=Anaeromyces robustus TaxID=1754192 RepID=A0A1Y1XIK8_9FUNG|nr:hypothetical protein BCR32DRAFT_265610 [Anaeromyces robustus]|eukprot:ORX85553.1 hypothetical protein BCR32DRAFT_265610 [Anaeromyces robustus]
MIIFYYVKYESECLVDDELYVNEEDKIDFSFSIEHSSPRLNITFQSNNKKNFDIEPQNIIINENKTDNENIKIFNNITLYGYNYGSSTLHISINSIDDNDNQNEINKTVKINVLHAEKKLFDSLVIAFTVFFLFAVGTGMPLSTVIKSIKVNRAKPLIAGILSQVLIIPLIAFSLTKIFQLNDIASYSVMMIASSPASLFAMIFVYYIGGDKALSICLCLISTLLSTITFPLIMMITSLANNLGLSYIIPIWQTLSGLFTQLIPISIGWITAHYLPIVTLYMTKALPIFACLAILTSVASSFLKMGISVFYQWETYVISILLSICSYLVGWILAKILKLNPFQCRSVCFHVGMQNTTIPIAIIQVSTGCLSPFLSIFPLHHSIYNLMIGIIIFLLFLFCFSVVETVVENSEIIDYRKSLENQLNDFETKDNRLSHNDSFQDSLSKLSKLSHDTSESLKRAKINI